MANGEGFLEKLYKQLWTRVGGEPWTDIIREDQEREPLVYLLIFFSLGIMAVKLTGKRWRWIVMAFGLGIIAGHFWW